MSPVFEVRQRPGAVVLRLVTDLDLATCADGEEQLRSAVAGPGYDTVVIDLTDRFVSARGLWLLGEVLVDAAARGRRWHVEGLDHFFLEKVTTTWFPGLRPPERAPLRLLRARDDGSRSRLGEHVDAD